MVNGTRHRARYYCPVLLPGIIAEQGPTAILSAVMLPAQQQESLDAMQDPVIESGANTISFSYREGDDHDQKGSARDIAVDSASAVSR